MGGRLGDITRLGLAMCSALTWHEGREGAGAERRGEDHSNNDRDDNGEYVTDVRPKCRDNEGNAAVSDSTSQHLARNDSVLLRPHLRWKIKVIL